MIQLRPGMWKMESSSSWGCNSYLIEEDDRLFLIDPGDGFQLKRIVRELEAAGRSVDEVTDVLLTHYDQDHSRSAAKFRRRTGAAVYLGAADAEILRSRTVPGSWQRRFMMRLLGLAELPESTVELRGKVTITPTLTALPSPGHTPGHYAFVWQDVAFIGDAANTDSDGELVPFDRALMTDPAEGDRTREMLAALPVRLFCSGHGENVERRTSRVVDSGVSPRKP
ncbi:MBL fold metallo-hydrolase [Microbacter sp. GSS18]|nr:MBL fold metallo-hydrolase [Microbacter sp. GSS18]